MSEGVLFRVNPTERNFTELSGWQLNRLNELPISILQINSLSVDNSPRRTGTDDEHIRLLAESEERLPPIVVHGDTWQVIDGAHRLQAAIFRGEHTIEARVYEGTEADAFLLAVQMNIAHGLPLSRADRTAAAAQIIQSHPQWSNRRIAFVAGLSAGTVGKLRRRSQSADAQQAMRVGKDGRIRPASNREAQLKVAQLLAAKPTASIRAIANEAGVSHSTVHAMRQRARACQAPTAPPTTRLQEVEESSATAQSPEIHLSPETSETPGPVRRGDIAAALASLKVDPSLRFKEEGRFLLRWLVQRRTETKEAKAIIEKVPDHCAGLVAKLARGYARVWSEFAEQLERR